MSSLVILAVLVFEISCGKRQTLVKILPLKLLLAWVTIKTSATKGKMHNIVVQKTKTVTKQN